MTQKFDVESLGQKEPCDNVRELYLGSLLALTQKFDIEWSRSKELSVPMLDFESFLGMTWKFDVEVW